MASFWNGYSLTDFLFPGFNIKTPEGFAGLFIAIVSISISYEGLRTLRDYVFRRFLDSKKESLLIRQSNFPAAQLVRYSKNGISEGGDEGEREALTQSHNINNGGGDVPAGPSTGNTDAIMDEDDSKYKRRSVSSVPYRDTATTIPLSPRDSSQRSRQWMDLSLSSLLHMVYVTVSYTLMLAVMTWNVMILVAVGIGFGIGYYFFGTLHHNAEFSIFRSFVKGDPCEERLLQSHDQSKTTESSSAGSASGSGNDLLPGSSGIRENGGGDGDPASTKELVIGVQVHATQHDGLTYSC